MVMVNAGRAGPARLSDSGSRMGAASLGQATPRAVSLTMHRSLTCADTVTKLFSPVEHCVRIEGVRGSNPLSSTKFSQARAPTPG